MGDHGHTLGGRHAAGLESTTYAAYLGPRFRRGARLPMDITDHAALWAHVFGYSRAPPAWLAAYRAGAVLPPDGGEGLVPPAPAAWAVALLALLAGGLCVPSTTDLMHKRALPALVASVGTMVALGALWPALRTFFWQSGDRIRLATPLCVIATALLGAPLLGWVSGFSAKTCARGLHAARDSSQRRCCSRCPRSTGWAGPTWPSGGCARVSWHRPAGWRRVVIRGRAAASVVSALLVLSLTPAKYANYVLRGFTVYRHWLPAAGAFALPLFSALLLLTTLAQLGARSGRRTAFWLAPLGGVALCASMGVIPDAWFAVPCVLALPASLLALVWPALVPASVALVLPALWFYFAGELAALAPLSAVWLLFALVPRALRGQPTQLRGAVLLVLIWMSFRVTMGCRISGVDFEFFVRFMPRGTDVTEHWLAQSLLTTAKYLIPPVFGALLAQAQEPLLGEAMRAAVQLARARVGLCLVFVTSLALTHPGAGAVMIGDATQEVASWLITLATLGVLSLTLPDPVVHEPS